MFGGVRWGGPAQRVRRRPARHAAPPRGDPAGGMTDPAARIMSGAEQKVGASGGQGDPPARLGVASAVAATRRADRASRWPAAATRRAGGAMRRTGRAARWLTMAASWIEGWTRQAAGSVRSPAPAMRRPESPSRRAGCRPIGTAGRPVSRNCRRARSGRRQTTELAEPIAQAGDPSTESGGTTAARASTAYWSGVRLLGRSYLPAPLSRATVSSRSFFRSSAALGVSAATTSGGTTSFIWSS